MKIKTKLNLGLGVLFLLILLLGFVAITNINAQKHDTENILKANYNSLTYANSILQIIGVPKSDAKFEDLLKLQEQNVTEKGEYEATLKLRKLWEQYQLEPKNEKLKTDIKSALFTIIKLNMNAISKKSDYAKLNADRANVWVSITAFLCFLVAFTLLVNLPANIANPIKELTKSIEEIAKENYSKRVNFEEHNEFGDLAKSFNQMAKKLSEYSESNLAKLLVQKKRIETLIENMPDPVIGLDESGKVLFVNTAGEKTIGLTKSELLGEEINYLAAKNDLLKVIINENTVHNKTLKIFVDGKESYFERAYLPISMVPTGEKMAIPNGKLIMLKNVTPFKELDSAKTNFIANVSHELKTPVAAIRMSLQLLENKATGDLNKDQQQLISSIDEDAERILKITSELLNMTQVESGSIKIALHAVDPLKIINYAIEANRTVAESRKIKFEVSADDDVMMIADSEKTAWILINLISNAIRYSYDHSSISIAVKQKDKKVEISVKDSGQGIAPEYKDKIFERYFRVPGTRKVGTGLGLSISKEFVEVQGGSIRLITELGVGSEFIVEFNKA
ncbi:MAG TPA: ATP-binding protein [Pelobium sp.]|nr:ATP-binding protein [Pelobium sp.]